MPSQDVWGLPFVWRRLTLGNKSLLGSGLEFPDPCYVDWACQALPGSRKSVVARKLTTLREMLLRMTPSEAHCYRPRRAVNCSTPVTASCWISARRSSLSARKGVPPGGQCGRRAGRRPRARAAPLVVLLALLAARLFGPTRARALFAPRPRSPLSERGLGGRAESQTARNFRWLREVPREHLAADPNCDANLRLD